MAASQTRRMARSVSRGTTQGTGRRRPRLLRAAHRGRASCSSRSSASRSGCWCCMTLAICGVPRLHRMGVWLGDMLLRRGRVHGRRATDRLGAPGHLPAAHREHHPAGLVLRRLVRARDRDAQLLAGAGRTWRMTTGSGRACWAGMPPTWTPRPAWPGRHTCPRADPPGWGQPPRGHAADRLGNMAPPSSQPWGQPAAARWSASRLGPATTGALGTAAGGWAPARRRHPGEGHHRVAPLAARQVLMAGPRRGSARGSRGGRPRRGRHPRRDGPGRRRPAP